MSIEVYENEWLLDHAVKPEDVVAAFQDIYIKLGHEFKWGQLDPDCKLFMLDKEDAEAAIDYKEPGKLLLTSKQFLIVDGVGAVLVEPVRILQEDVAGLNGLVYIHDPRSSWSFITSFVLGFTREKGGTPECQHFRIIKGKDKDENALNFGDAFAFSKDTKTYRPIPKENHHVLIKDIIHSVTIAIDQCFYLKDKTGDPFWDVPVFTPKEAEGTARPQRD